MRSTAARRRRATYIKGLRRADKERQRQVPSHEQESRQTPPLHDAATGTGGARVVDALPAQHVLLPPAAMRDDTPEPQHAGARAGGGLGTTPPILERPDADILAARPIWSADEFDPFAVSDTDIFDSGVLGTYLDNRARTTPGKKDTFSRRERVDTYSTGWRGRRRALALLAAVAVLVALIGGFAYIASSRVAGSVAKRVPTGVTGIGTVPAGVAIQPVTGNTSPTPALAPALIGAWVSDSAPSGGSVTAYARVTNGTAPLAGVLVTISVNGTVVGKLPTDGYGTIAFPVSYGGSRGRPVFITMSATVSGTEISADTTFVPH